MIMLLLTTISMGILDSFNPVALTQQFLLQGLVGKRRHILYFSGAVGITNLLGGLLIYYGLDKAVAAFWSTLGDQYFWIIPACEIILGILAWVYVAYRRINKKFTESFIARSEAQLGEKAAIRSVHPVALSAMGAFAVLCEIPTSLPYFAFLAVLLQFDLAFPALLAILILYNTLFTLPLYLMYALYLKCRSRVDRLYHLLKDKVFRYGTILLPVLAAIIGVMAIFHASYLLYTA